MGMISRKRAMCVRVKYQMAFKNGAMRRIKRLLDIQ